MALTIANTGEDKQPQRIGQYRAAVKVVTADASYPTGGYPLTPAQLGLSKIDVLIAETAGAGAAAAYAVRYNYGTQKLLFYTGGGAAGTALTEVANATSLAGINCRIFAYGR